MYLLQITPEVLWTSLICIVLVFGVLVLLVGIIQLFGKAVTYHREKIIPKTEVKLHEEEIAAIMTALKLYKSALHDKESEVLTILSIKRAYSPWSSKIHGLTQLPTKK
uniref:hypothetical protein n=1 Tax=Alistipes sp. TaxID=1872444 RepID=UPI004055A6C6